MASIPGRPTPLTNLPRSTLGEGPVWDPDNNTLYWVDILGNRLHIYKPSSGYVRSFNIGPYPSCVMLNFDGSLVVTLRDRVVLVNPLDGSIIRTLAVVDEGPENRFNDCRCDPTGRLVAGTMDMGESRPTGSLYVISPDLGVRKIYSNVTISNGLEWSSDGSTLYYIDSPTRRVTIFRYNIKDGSISGVVDYIDVSSQPGIPDGMAIDENGHPWVAFYGGGRVVEIDPARKSMARVIEVNARYTTSCTFGGENLDTLYITTAMGREASEAGFGGYLFTAKVGVKGVRARRCRF